jgi:hypothetical protein
MRFRSWAPEASPESSEVRHTRDSRVWGKAETRAIRFVLTEITLRRPRITWSSWYRQKGPNFLNFPKLRSSEKVEI